MNPAEQAFYAHLTVTESLDYIVREGFNLETVQDVIPTELGRKLTSWAIDYYFKSGRTVAPSKEAIMQTWKDQLEPLDITIDDETEQDSIQWAVSQLRNDFADYITGEFSKEMVMEVRQADGPDRAAKVQEYSQLLHGVSQSLISRRNEMNFKDGVNDAIARYEIREKEDHKYHGMTFGLPEVDEHTLGIHPGELCVFAAPSGGGKSFWAIKVLLAEFERKRKSILFTLENDLEMTYDRLACMHCRVPYDLWQRAEVEPGDMKRVKDFAEQLQDEDHGPLIIKPDIGEATGLQMVRRAQIEDADSIIVDQLSHVEPVIGSKARQRNEVVAEIVRDFVRNISQDSAKLSALLLHQINREGIKAARGTGKLLMEHLGEAKQVGDDASLALGLYQSPDHMIAEQAELQMLKQRRITHKDWEITWRPALGDIRVRRELEPE
jgi:hypothetical protein